MPAPPEGSGAVRLLSRRRVLGLIAGGVVLGAGAVGGRLVFGHDESAGGGRELGSAGSPRLGMLEPARPEIGKPAPDFALIDARDGRTVRRLSDYRGKPLILNWYASWCGPCKAEIPDFQKVYAALDGAIVVLGANLQESRETAAGMLQSLGATFPSVLDSDGTVGRHYRLLGMPTTFFIDRDGVVRAFATGRVTPEALQEQLARLGQTY
jgi:cytochrome c biogenesis protein CcmG/thiol:disulfide interchange protein DsbE